MHGLVAARLGDTEMALKFLRKSADIDLADAQVATDGGIHIAALGGIWMLTVFGFAGLSFGKEGVDIDPHLPGVWQSLTFRVQWRGRCLKISIDRDRRIAESTLEAGEPMMFSIRGERHELHQGLGLKVSTGRL
jgi:trehalose/maltose hydrolase-like predicted phosphorylase